MVFYYHDNSKFLYITPKTNALASGCNYVTRYVCMYVRNSVVIAL